MFEVIDTPEVDVARHKDVERGTLVRVRGRRDIDGVFEGVVGQTLARIIAPERPMVEESKSSKTIFRLCNKALMRVIAY